MSQALIYRFKGTFSRRYEQPSGSVQVYDPQQRTTRTLPVAEAATVLTAYWTPARRAAAVPRTDVETATAASASAPAATAERGTPTRVSAPVAPAAPTLRAASVTFANAEGKVYFTDPRDGLNYQCSGGTVNSGKRRLVWTAGHCVHGGPGGRRAAGTRAGTGTTTTGWASPGTTPPAGRSWTPSAATGSSSTPDART